MINLSHKSHATSESEKHNSPASVSPLLSHFGHTHNPSDTRLWEFPPVNDLWHLLGTSNLNQFWNYLPGNSIRYQGDLPPHQMPITSSRPEVTHNFVWLGYRSEVPIIPSSSLITLLQWLTELREAPPYTDQFSKVYGKGYRRTARWRDAQGEVWQGPEHTSTLSLYSQHRAVTVCHVIYSHRLLSKWSFWFYS